MYVKEPGGLKLGSVSDLEEIQIKPGISLVANVQVGVTLHRKEN